MTASLNETVGNARFECPVNHYLESWDDAEIMPGQLSSVAALYQSTSLIHVRSRIRSEMVGKYELMA